MRSEPIHEWETVCCSGAIVHNHGGQVGAPCQCQASLDRPPKSRLTFFALRQSSESLLLSSWMFAKISRRKSASKHLHDGASLTQEKMTSREKRLKRHLPAKQ